MKNIKYIFFTLSVMAACHGFWGSLFPDLTFIEGTYRIIDKENVLEDMSLLEKEQFLADILDGKYRVTYSSKLLETIRNKCGYQDEERDIQK